jgi:hypothetical protein
MPYALVMDKLNPILTAEAIQILKSDSPEIVEQIGQPGTLVDVANSVVGLEQQEIDYLQAVPMALREAARAAISAAIADDKAVHLQFSPAYDFEVRVWDYGQAVSVHLCGPYPPSFPRAGFVDAG